MLWLVMKNLKDTILEKLKIDDIVPDKEKFNISRDFQKNINFLKDNSFKKIKNNFVDWKSVFDKMNEESAKVYAFSPSDTTDTFDILKFAYTSEMNISNNNPLFHILYNTESKRFEYQICYNSKEYDKVSKKVFLEKINKYFGWEIK